EALDRLHAPGVAAAVWRRGRPEPLGPWLDALPPERLPRFRARLGVPQVGAAVDAACGIAGLAPGPERRALASDLGALAALFGRLTGSAEVDVRLEAIATDGCRRYHVDRVRARLLCTLPGPGTELALPAPGGSVRLLRQLAAGEVAALRGTLWPGEETGLLHRSPPVEGTGTVPLLFVLDPADGPDDTSCGCCP
ncbi:MAG: DUF1826 domain-containing protein, partial [Rubrimonas sp.]